MSVSNSSKCDVEDCKAMHSPTGRNSIFKRMFSTESTSTGRFSYNLYPHPDYTYSLCGKEVLLKLSQVIISMICAGLYSATFSALDHTSTTVLSIIVYISFIIISGVICLGYILGHVMHELLQRAFNAIAVVLFFISCCITFQISFATFKYEDNRRYMTNDAKLMFVQAALSGINCILYAVDVGISIKKSLSINILVTPK